MIVHSNETTANRIGSVSSPGLRRNVLTRDGKRLQLASKNVRGAEADEILDKLYGPLPTQQYTRKPDEPDAAPVDQLDPRDGGGGEAVAYVHTLPETVTAHSFTYTVPA